MIFFVSAFSKSIERNWPLELVLSLIQAMREQARWRDSYFVINVVPEQIDRSRTHSCSMQSTTSSSYRPP